MIITDNMNGFKMTSDLGQFNAMMYSPKNSYSTPELITDMDNSQRDEYLVVIEDNMEEVFKLMKEGADSNTLAKILVSETMINNCTPTREEDKTALREKLATYESTEITINSPTKDYPDAYSGRLYKENGVQMDVKIKINTNTGECRRTATVTMQKINNEWKIVNIVTNDSKNIFSDFNVFNPAW